MTDSSVPVSIRQLRKVFRSLRAGTSVVAVDGLSLDVQPGEVLGLIGPNGSGKTTTIRCLLGLARPTSGSCFLNGVDSEGLQRQDLASIGALLNPPPLDSSLTGETYLRVLAAKGALPVDRVHQTLRRVEAGDFAHRPIGKMSTGMRQRINLASALLRNPLHLILDEPMSGLDPEGLAILRNESTRTANRGGAVVISSHQFAELERLCSTVAVLNRGTLVAHGPPASLVTQHTVVVRCNDLRRGREVLAASGLNVVQDGDRLRVSGVEAPEVVARALIDAGLTPTELTPDRSALEDAYFRLTRDVE